MMTTIVYRGGVLAADTSLVYGGTMIIGITKIIRREDGVMAGAAGRADYAAAFLAWAAGDCEGEPPVAKHEDDSFDRGCIFAPSGDIDVHEPGGVIHIKPSYYAFGSGKELAIGAMFAGATAEQAVIAAIEHDPNTGGGVTVLSHEVEPNAPEGEDIVMQEGEV